MCYTKQKLKQKYIQPPTTIICVVGGDEGGKGVRGLRGQKQ